MSATPKILIQQMWDVTVVDCQEPRLIDPQQIEAVGQELYRLIDEMDRKKLVLDMTKVQFLGSAAIGVLTTVLKKSAAIKGTFIICGLRRELMKVFEIMKLTKAFRFAATEGEALEQLGYKTAH